MTVAAILSNKGGGVISITAQTSVREAVSLLAARRIGAVPVMAGDSVAGIFSERDVIHALESHGAATLDRMAGEVMTSPAIAVGPDEAAIGALALMTRRRVRHLPVIDGGRMIGFVSIGDLVKYRLDWVEADAAAMRSYIQSA